MKFKDKQFLKKQLQRIVLFFAIILFTNCEPALISSNHLNANRDQTLKINMFDEESANYALSGTAIGGNKLTEIYASFFSCSVSGDVGNGNSIKLSTATIIWNNNCAFKIDSVVYNGVTYAAAGTNPSITMSSSIYTAQVGTGTSLTSPINIPLSSGYQLQLTATNLYISAFSGGTSYSPPSITFVLNLSTMQNSSAGISSTIIPFVGAGDGFSCALVFPGGMSTAGEVYCWGNGGAGRVATGTAIGSNTFTSSVTGYYNYPKKLVMPSGFAGNPVSLAVGNEIACVLDQSGSPWCWGLFGSGSTFSNDILKKDTTASYTSIVAGYKTACGITSAGAVKCWGDLSSITGGGTNVTTATTVSNNYSSVSQIAVGMNFICGLISGNVQCYGNNDYGQLGINSRSSLALGSSKQVVTQGGSATLVAGSGTLQGTPSTLSNVTSITANGKVACATLSGTNNAYCWGNVNGAKDIDNLYTIPYYSHFELLGNGSYNIFCPIAPQPPSNPICSSNSDFVAFASPVRLFDNDYYDSDQNMENSGTPISLSLSSISVGMAAACGINSAQRNTYTCWGINLTNPKAQFKSKDILFYNMYGTNWDNYWALIDWGTASYQYSAAYASPDFATF